MVTYEALAYGLPVIATPNTGSIIHNGKDGFIVPSRDPSAIVERLQFLFEQPEKLKEMSRMTNIRSADICIEAYGKKLISSITNC